MHTENVLSVPVFLHLAGSFRSTQGRGESANLQSGPQTQFQIPRACVNFDVCDPVPCRQSVQPS